MLNTKTEGNVLSDLFDDRHFRTGDNKTADPTVIGANRYIWQQFTVAQNPILASDPTTAWARQYPMLLRMTIAGSANISTDPTTVRAVSVPVPTPQPLSPTLSNSFTDAHAAGQAILNA